MKGEKLSLEVELFPPSCLEDVPGSKMSASLGLALISSTLFPLGPLVCFQMCMCLDFSGSWNYPSSILNL
jgi:hypothetical protein